MGNTDCRFFDDYEDNDIITGKGKYSFKKSHKPINEKEKMFYAKEDKLYNAIESKIDRTVSMVRHGETRYENGNVLVIKPC
jgi:hypothetical protein